MIKYTRKDVFQPSDRAKYYFPEGTFIVVGVLSCIGGVLAVLSGQFAIGVVLLPFAFALFAFKGIIGALYDIREYQARRAKRMDEAFDE